MTVSEMMSEHTRQTAEAVESGNKTQFELTCLVIRQWGEIAYKALLLESGLHNLAGPIVQDMADIGRDACTPHVHDSAIDAPSCCSPVDSDPKT